MEIINDNAGVLSNFEVYQTILQNRSTTVKRRRTATQAELHDLRTVEHRVIKYLESIGTNRQTDEWAVTTIARLKAFNLTTTELIQVLNHMPTEVLEFHVLLDDLPSRFTAEEQAQLCRIARLAGPSGGTGVTPLAGSTNSFPGLKGLALRGSSDRTGAKTLDDMDTERAQSHDDDELDTEPDDDIQSERPIDSLQDRDDHAIEAEALEQELDEDETSDFVGEDRKIVDDYEVADAGDDD